jgi:aldehyde dehydrogenase (NAD+)
VKPLIGAIAAGNCVVIKPSEVSAAVSSVYAELIPKYLDTRCIRCVEGGAEVCTDLLDQQWDYILYTGGPTVGKIIMQAASKFLTPVTLELGGKSPCFVDKNVNLEISAKRIVW